MKLVLIMKSCSFMCLAVFWHLNLCKPFSATVHSPHIKTHTLILYIFTVSMTKTVAAKLSSYHASLSYDSFAVCVLSTETKIYRINTESVCTLHMISRKTVVICCIFSVWPIVNESAQAIVIRLHKKNNQHIANNININWTVPWYFGLNISH